MTLTDELEDGPLVGRRDRHSERVGRWYVDDLARRRAALVIGFVALVFICLTLILKYLGRI